MRLSDVLDSKGWETVVTHENVTATEAVKLMCDKHVGAVVISDAKGRIGGILTERDILRRYAEYGNKLGELKVSKIMTHKVETAEPDASVDEVLNTMTNKRFRHIPVVRGGKLVGIVSIGDMVKAMLQEKMQEADSLREYITS
ncbi:MAG TPA: CBS domain-containing protein [Gammaproteobacteria bacterium]|nr:CBS domain-containing protein [Gammaproteobacteria bacterium]